MSEIKATKIELVSINSIVNHPKNMNKHPELQIEMLARLIQYQGFRNPIVVQAGTNLIVAGHGRVEAAKRLGMETVPVVYQEFESEAMLYAYMVSDNAIAAWAELDLALITDEVKELEDFDLDMLGIEDFEIDTEEPEEPKLGNDPDIQSVTFILSNEQKDILDEALEKAIKEEFIDDEINNNRNGNILAAILKSYLRA